jgi:hypothetical protein
MDQKIPFTSYDFWAYLSAGFVVLAAIDYVAGTHLLYRETWTVVQGVMALVSAYIVGQIVASMSSYTFEKVLVVRLLGAPRMVLFDRPRAWRWVRRMIPGYFEPLPPTTQTQILEKAAPAGATAPGEALYWCAFAYARATPSVMGRLENFLNLYGFARNVSLAAGFDAVLLYWHYLWNGGDELALYLARASFVVSVGMLLRYLKFFRQYALEVFTAYAHSKAEAPAGTGGTKP